MLIYFESLDGRFRVHYDGDRPFCFTYGFFDFGYIFVVFGALVLIRIFNV
jgi:hypothetical protein